MPTHAIGPGKQNMAITMDEGEPSILGWLAAQRDVSRNEMIREFLRPLLREAREVAKEMGRALPAVCLLTILGFSLFVTNVERPVRRGGRRRNEYALSVVPERGEG